MGGSAVLEELTRIGAGRAGPGEGWNLRVGGIEDDDEVDQDFYNDDDEDDSEEDADFMEDDNENLDDDALSDDDEQDL